jgi:hypothetical protein
MTFFTTLSSKIFVEGWKTEDTEWLTDLLEQSIEKYKGDSYVYRMDFDDLVFYHGEGGWCLQDDVLDYVGPNGKTVEQLLDEAVERVYPGAADEAFYVRLKTP